MLAEMPLQFPIVHQISPELMSWYQYALISDIVVPSKMNDCRLGWWLRWWEWWWWWWWITWGSPKGTRRRTTGSWDRICMWYCELVLTWLVLVLCDFWIVLWLQFFFLFVRGIWYWIGPILLDCLLLVWSPYWFLFHLIWLIWLKCFDLNWFYINFGLDCDWLITLLVLVSSHWRHLIWLIWLKCFDLNWFYINFGFDCYWLITWLVLVSSHWRHLTHNLTLHGLCIGSPT